MTIQEKLLMDGCKLMGLSFDEYLATYQILLSQEQIEDMLLWMIKNINSNPQGMDVILAACEIQEKNKNN